MANNGTGCLTVALTIQFIVFLIIAIAIFIGARGNNSTTDFVKSAQITTIDSIQKRYKEMAASVQASSDPVLIGNYEVTGTTTSILTTPHSKTPCLYYSYSVLHNFEELKKVEIEDYRSENRKHKKYIKQQQWKSGSSYDATETKALPFILHDDTGDLSVDPQDATYYVGLLKKTELVSSPRSNHPTKREISVNYEESYMPFDGPITVVGAVYAQNGQLTMKAAPELVISNVTHDGILEDVAGLQKGLNILAIVLLVIGGLPFFIMVGVRSAR